MTMHHDLAIHIREFCAEIGRDPLLVQGAGGNVSWKTHDTLWIKASGTWLSDALNQDIFVPVDLLHLQNAIDQQDYSAVPKVGESVKLRPSIETMLHALMPNKVVVHLHAVEILAHLVCEDAVDVLQRQLPKQINWAIVPYYKPGAQLARAVHQSVSTCPDADVIFLQNHGVVFGGSTLTEIQQLMRDVLNALNVSWRYEPYMFTSKTSEVMNLHAYGYQLSTIEHFHSLACDSQLLAVIQRAWAMYPDHVVFLGPIAVVTSIQDVSKYHELLTTQPPPYLFVLEHGTFVHHTASKAHHEQLQCYFDIILRLEPHRKIVTLTQSQIEELLNWDAEKYRQQMRK